MPALLTRMSIPPNASTVAFTAALTSARCETSQRTATALLLIDAAAARAASPSMSTTATRALAREGRGNALAEARCRAGDERNLVVETHATLPLAARPAVVPLISRI